MRITNLHLIVSFLILSAVGFLWYQRFGSPLKGAALPALPADQAGESAAAVAEKPDASADGRLADIRRRVEETIANAFSDIEVAKGLGFDVAPALKSYEQAKDVFSRAQTVDEMAEAKKLAELAIQETLGPSAGKSIPGAVPASPGAEPGPAPSTSLPGLSGLEPPATEPAPSQNLGESEYLPGLEPPADVTVPAPEQPAAAPALDEPAAPAPPAKSSLPGERPSFYVVRHGDNLWNIAKRPEVYGRGARWVSLWRANEDKVPDFDVLASGTRLTIPSE